MRDREGVQNYMNVLNAILEGIPGALLATLITVLAVRLLPPRIKISQQIATMWSDERSALRSRFKIVNMSRRTIVELRFELVILYYKDGKTRTLLVSPERPEPISIAGRDKKRKEWGDYVVAYDEKLLDDLIQREAIGDKGCELRFRVFGRDSFSGAGKQFQMKYERLFDGTFVYGAFEDDMSMEIEHRCPHERWSQKLSQAETAIQDRAVSGGKPARSSAA